ncbi:hypothetical protein E3A20_28430 [Planctomyces bekefii]|uniref:Uncharacterized protein n=1 Tax=Planctomyces bekefii TaxID=1653850 RepID=A0A5C6M092_9PLAN|nr:hypothetical protein E3A20_28430 [Planctomyces bekefii]
MELRLMKNERFEKIEWSWKRGIKVEEERSREKEGKKMRREEM